MSTSRSRSMTQTDRDLLYLDDVQAGQNSAATTK